MPCNQIRKALTFFDIDLLTVYDKRELLHLSDPLLVWL
jgi:hypothetical protein